jgi:hypothetical protein
VLRFVVGRGAAAEAPLTAAAGFAVFGVAWLGAADCGLFGWPVIVALLAGGGLVGVARSAGPARSRSRRRRASPPSRRGASAGWGGRWAVACAGLAVAAMFAGAIGPETGMDALIYHLPRARGIALEGRVLPQPSLLYGFAPFWEAWLAAMLVVGGEPAARLLSPAVLVACGWLLWRAVDRDAPGAGVLAAALFLTSWLVLEAAGSVKNDPAAAWLACGAFAAALRARAGGGRWAALAGGLAGSALLVKVTAGPAVLLAAAAAWLGGVRPRPRRLAVFAAAAVLVWLSWAAFNAVTEGNPAHPLWSGGSLHAPGPGAADNIRAELRRYVRGRYDTVAEKLRAPWSLAVAEGATVLPILLLPAIVAALAAGAAGRWWTFGAAALVAAWSAGPPQPRYLLPALPLAAGALAIFGATAGAGRMARWRSGLLAVLMAAGAARGWLDPSRDLGARLDVALGRLPRDAYLRLRLTTCADALLEANVAPGAGRVLLFGERRVWPLERPCLAGWLDDRAPILRAAAASRDAAHLARKVRQLRGTTAVYNFVTASYLGVEQERTRPKGRALAVWADYWRAHAVLRYASPCSDDVDGEFATFDLVRVPRRGVPPPLLPAAEGWLEVCTRRAEAGDRVGALAALDRVTRLTGGYPVFALRRVWLAGDALPAAEARADLERAEAGGLRIAHLYVQLARAARREGRRDVFDRAMARLVEMEPGRWLRRTLAP